MSRKLATLTLLAGLSLSGAALANLNPRGGGLIYDDVLNITWLQDANYAKTSGYSASGAMSWAAANAWAANLSYGGYDDWRLPIIVDTGTAGCTYAVSGSDCGYNVQTVGGGTVYSELAYMYSVNLGLKPYLSVSNVIRSDWGIFGNATLNGIDGSSSGQNDVGLIRNLQAKGYWSATSYAPNGGFAWYFDNGTGNQYATVMNQEYQAWAVRNGDVAAVPEPASAALLLAGLALIGWRARRPE